MGANEGQERANWGYEYAGLMGLCTGADEGQVGAGGSYVGVRRARCGLCGGNECQVGANGG